MNKNNIIDKLKGFNLSIKQKEAIAEIVNESSTNDNANTNNIPIFVFDGRDNTIKEVAPNIHNIDSSTNVITFINTYTPIEFVDRYSSSNIVNDMFKILAVYSSDGSVYNNIIGTFPCGV